AVRPLQQARETEALERVGQAQTVVLQAERSTLRRQADALEVAHGVSHDVDHGALGAAAVERRTRTAPDLDAPDVLERQVEIHAGRAARDGLVESLAVQQ